MKVAKIRHAFVKLQRIVFTKVSLCLQLHGKQNIFDVVLWFSIVLLLSGDIEINPGPDSVLHVTLSQRPLLKHFLTT